MEEKDNVFIICFHHKQFFGKVFERKADKCGSILKSHCRNSKAHRVINLEMAKILKKKDSLMYYLVKKWHITKLAVPYCKTQHSYETQGKVNS